MKYKFSYLLIWTLLFLFFAGLVLYAFELDKVIIKQPLPHKRIEYLRDSLEMEYYKKAIEESYPFDHSKIPVYESNIRVQHGR